MSVPLDRSGHVPGTVSLFVERAATATVPSPGALFLIVGGPGQAATPLTAAYRSLLAPALRTRDLIVFDQRGTGRSDALSCPRLDSAQSQSALDLATYECAVGLGARRAFYTSRDSADDIDAIRQSLGLQRIALYGISYGTYTAITYARRYPQHVELLMLDSVVPPTGVDPFNRSTFEAIPRVLRDICAGDCRRITRHPFGDLSRLVARLRRRPQRTAVYTPHGRRIPVSLGAGDILDAIGGGDLDPTIRAALPAALRSGLAGDGAPLARLVDRADAGSTAARRSDGTGGVDLATYLATLCEEEQLPWARTAPLSTRPGSLFGALLQIPARIFSPWRRGIAIDHGNARPCLAWPDGSPDSPVVSGPLPNVPALILDGVDDTRTPLSDAEQVAALLPQSHFVAVPDVGHSVLGLDLSHCSEDAVAEFFGGRPVTPCAPGPKAFPPIPIAPRSLGALHPTAGTRGLRGRGVSAVRATLADAVRVAIGDLVFASPHREGGLRGGDFAERLSGSTLRLVFHRDVYVPGVAVSGVVVVHAGRPNGDVGHLTVSGSAGVVGTLTLHARSLSGRLDGRRVHARGGSLSAAADESTLEGDLQLVLAHPHAAVP